ncbi:hypothetical protein BCY76_015815 [Nesterenkonia sp. PF2B19]|nr:hypothetical protein BCY76_015815 [Nesterenkonia sp. PF2B19]
MAHLRGEAVVGDGEDHLPGAAHPQRRLLLLVQTLGAQLLDLLGGAARLVLDPDLHRADLPTIAQHVGQRLLDDPVHRESEGGIVGQRRTLHGDRQGESRLPEAS